MQRFILSATMLLLLSGCEPIKAADATTPCYDIISEAEMPKPIRINKCTGDTWMLVVTTVEKGATIRDDSTVYRWYPILVEWNEATLIYPKH